METQARYRIVGLCTLVAAAAGFFFVYWLHNTGGPGAQTLYRVRFDQPVIGMRPGIVVLLNGLRVGEVQRVQLEPENPKQVSAVIAIDPATPVRADTHVGIDAQGLLGSIVVSLTGGSAATAPAPRPDGSMPLLVADPNASESLTQAAKGTLGRFDAMLDDNSAALRSAIGNVNTFSQALAQNSGRVTGILAGLEKTLGVGAPAAPPVSYDLGVPSFPAAGKPLETQLAVPDVSALVVFDTQRALVSPTPDQRRPVEPGQWSDSLPKLVQAKIAQSFEDAGFTHVSRSTEGFTPDVQAVLGIRAFELQLSPEPTAHVDLSVKLLGADGKIMNERSFSASVPAGGADAPAAFTALNQAFSKVAYDLVMWVEQSI